MKEAALLIVLFSAAAVATSHLNCSITKSHNGSFRHQISEEPSSPKCTASWEDRNEECLTVQLFDTQGTVIVDILGKYDHHLVTSHTLHSVTLKECKDFLLYKRECDGVQVKASCSVNCSLFAVNSHPPSRVCLSLNICTDTVTAGVSAAAVVTVLPLLLFLLWLVRKWRSGACRSAHEIYAPPSEQEQVQIEMEGKGTIKTPQ